MDSINSQSDAAGGLKVPEGIKRLYEVPQAEWSLEAWRELAVYLADSLMQVRKSEAAALALANSVLERAAHVVSLSSGRSAGWTATKPGELGLSAGLLTFKKHSALKARRGRPKRRSQKGQAVFDMGFHVLAISMKGPWEAAETIARAELEGKNPGGRVNKNKLKARRKTIANTYTAVKMRIAARLISEIGPGPAYEEALSRICLIQPDVKK
jgi:hypothetical protein